MKTIPMKEWRIPREIQMFWENCGLSIYCSTSIEKYNCHIYWADAFLSEFDWIVARELEYNTIVYTFYDNKGVCVIGPDASQKETLKLIGLKAFW